jgi:hypothetical protein
VACVYKLEGTNYCENECLAYGLVLLLLIVVSQSLSAVAGYKQRYININSQNSCMYLLGKHLYQTSTEINDSLANTNNVKGLH